MLLTQATRHFQLFFISMKTMRFGVCLVHVVDTHVTIQINESYETRHSAVLVISLPGEIVNLKFD